MSNSPIIGPSEPFPEAPEDGTPYERQDAAWVAAGQTIREVVIAKDLGGGRPTHLMVRADDTVAGAVYYSAVTDQVVMVRYAADGITIQSQLVLGSDGVSISGPGGLEPVIEDDQDLVTMKWVQDNAITFLRDLDDVLVDTPPEVNDYLTWNGAQWVNIPRPPDVLQEAPQDGSTYGRNNAAWVEVLGVEIVSFTSDPTSDLEANVFEGWNEYGNRNNVTRTSNQLVYFRWPSTSEDVYQYIGSQLAPIWTSTALDWVSMGGGTVSWGQITGSIDSQTDLANALDAKGGVGIDLTFDPSTVEGDPLNGKIRINTADQSLATFLYVSAFSALGNSLRKHWNGHQTGDLYNLVENGAEREFITLELTGDPINNSTWYKIPVTVLDFRGPMNANIAVSLFYTNDPRSTVRIGGATGQVLAKSDGNDFNMVWVDPDTGPQGIPGAAATADAGLTTTLAPGAVATVDNSGTTAAAVFDFGIPEGVAGAQGIDGADGIQGVDGNTVLNGIIDPIAADGVDGDFFLNTATSTLFGPKAAGVWPAGTSLVGPQGVDGPTGPEGPIGLTGADSTVPGPAGADGADSVVPGPDGPAGPEGPSAVSADAGNTAVLGADSLIFVPDAGGLIGIGVDTIEVVAVLPATPVATTLYFITG